MKEHPESVTCTETKDGISCDSRHKNDLTLALHKKKTIDHQGLYLAGMKFPPGKKNEITGLYECGIGDCEKKDFVTKSGMVKHQDTETHPNTL